jgi:hypothetical protein
MHYVTSDEQMERTSAPVSDSKKKTRQNIQCYEAERIKIFISMVHVFESVNNGIADCEQTQKALHRQPCVVLTCMWL